MSAAALLAAAEAGHVTALVAAAASDPPGDAMLALDDSELTRFWAATDQIVESALDVAEPAMKPDEPSDDEAVGQALDTLYAITILAHASIADPERAAPEELTEVACRLHDIIFDLTDPRASQLQSAIVALCEAWWLSEREGRVDLVPQTVSYMLVRALHEKATTADIKRLYTFRQALTSLDHADETVLPLQRLLLHCAIRPNILRCAEGRKLVAYFFSLHVPFIAELHRSIKSQIPVCRKSQREAYGEVYFRAWRNAAPGSDALAEIEERCVQDLMWHGLHASSTSVASAVRQVLAFTNNQKRQRGVDAMLHKLWAPLLWRNMQVANPHMRRNAATLFVEAFPLYDPAMSTVDIDGALQRQFDALSKLLMDESVGVRVVAVHGTCRVLALFWELIPSSTSRAFLTTLVKDLAHDASANTDGALVAKIAESLGAPAATAASAAAAGKKRGRKSKGGDGDGRLAAPLALKALWAALTTASTRECLLSNQSTALKNLLPLLEGRANGLAAATAGGAAASDGALATVDEAQRAMSCYVQLSWHLASKAAATAAAAEANADTAGAGRAPKGGKRLTKADKAAAEASAASEAALSAREAGSLALDRVMAWTAADAPAPRTDSATSATLGEIAFIEPSPGQARQRTRPRTVLDENNPGNQPMSAFDESPMKAPPANAAGESALAAQILGCAWLAEGGMLGLMNAAQASRAVDYVRTTLRAAAAASPASASDAERSASPFAQVLPHVSKMVVLLFEGLPAHTPDAKPNEAAAAELHFLATDLLFGLLEAGTSSADAAPAARALLLESMALVAVERPFSLDILVRRLLAHVTAAIGTSLAAAQSAGARTEPTDAEGCGVGGLDLPPLSAAVAEALTLRTAGCAPALLPSLSAACVGAFERADAPALTACVTFLLACDGMRRPELPGRLELRRALEGLGDASKAAAALEAGADLNVVAPSGAMRARMDALPAEARASFGQLAPPLLRASALLAAE